MRERERWRERASKNSVPPAGKESMKYGKQERGRQTDRHT